MDKFDRIMTNALVKKRWRNIGNFCNRKTHPSYFPYRRYRRGKSRCLYCGAKLGKVKCVMQSSQEMLIDNIFTSSPLLDLLKQQHG